MNNLFFLETRARDGKRYFLELDRDQNSRQAVIEMIASGEVDPVKILEVCEDDGRVFDVTQEVVALAELLRHRGREGDRPEFDRAAWLADRRVDERKHSEVV